MCRSAPFFALVAVILNATPLFASDPAGVGLDLVVLVDRSGSMASYTSAGIVDALPLTLNALAWSGRSTRVNHRVGIVSFGSQARLDLPLTLVDAAHLPLLRNRIGQLDSASLGGTNFVEAFERAAAAFDAVPRDVERRRAIILLTDGHIDVPGEDATASRKRLLRFLSGAPATPPVAVHVVLVGDSSGRALWDRLAPDRVHEAHGDRADLLALMHHVVADLVGTRTVQRDLGRRSVTIAIPPYLELVVFDVVRGHSGRDTAIRPPGSSEPLHPQSVGVEEMHVGDALSTVVIRRPAAGTWTFVNVEAAAHVKVLSQQFFPRGKLVDPAAPVRQHDARTIAYRLEDGAGRPLQELAGYPLAVDVSVALPDGKRFVLPMMRGMNSLFRATTKTHCDVVGRYWTEIFVTTADSNGEPVRIYEDRWSGFNVEPAALRASAMPMQQVVPRRNQERHDFSIMAAVLVAAVIVLVVTRRR